VRTRAWVCRSSTVASACFESFIDKLNRVIDLAYRHPRLTLFEAPHIVCDYRVWLFKVIFQAFLLYRSSAVDKFDPAAPDARSLGFLAAQAFRQCFVTCLFVSCLTEGH
jgi:hypothetical protein